MKNIKIIRGTYGHRKTGSTITSPKTRTDPAFPVDDDEAQRLVKMGIAEYANEAPPAETAGTGKIMETLSLNQIARLNKQTHERLAERLNVDLSATTNKDGRAKVIWDELERLNAAVVEVKKDVYEVVEETEEDIEEPEDDPEDEDEDDEDSEDTEEPEDPPAPGANVPVT